MFSLRASKVRKCIADQRFWITSASTSLPGPFPRDTSLTREDRRRVSKVASGWPARLPMLHRVHVHELLQDVRVVLVWRASANSLEGVERIGRHWTRRVHVGGRVGTLRHRELGVMLHVVHQRGRHVTIVVRRHVVVVIIVVVIDHAVPGLDHASFRSHVLLGAILTGIAVGDVAPVHVEVAHAVRILRMPRRAEHAKRCHMARRVVPRAHVWRRVYEVALVGRHRVLADVVVVIGRRAGWRHQVRRDVTEGHGQPRGLGGVAASGVPRASQGPGGRRARRSSCVWLPLAGGSRLVHFHGAGRFVWYVCKSHPVWVVSAQVNQATTLF